MSIELLVACESTLMSRIFNATCAIAEAVNIRFNANGMYFDVMDGSNVIIMWCDLKSSNFTSFNLPRGDQTIGMRLDPLAKVLKRGCSENRKLVMIKRTNEDHVHFRFTENDEETESQIIKTMNLDTDCHEVPTGEGNSFKMPSSAFNDTVHSLCGEYVKFEMVAGVERVFLVADSNSYMRSRVTINASQPSGADDNDVNEVEVNAIQSVQSLVPIKFLDIVIKSTLVAKMVTVYVQDDDKPLMISYEIANDQCDGNNDHTNCCGSVKYYLCQRLPGIDDVDDPDASWNNTDDTTSTFDQLSSLL